MNRTLTLAGVAALLLAPVQAYAQHNASFGPQLNWGDDVDFGIGGRVVIDVPGTLPLSVIGSFDWFFPEEVAGVDRTYWEINGNVVYDFKIADPPTFIPYGGAGLNVAHFSSDGSDVGGVEDSNTDLGVNVLGGGRVEVGSIAPFLEVRIEAGGGNRLVITGGVLF